MKVFHQNYLRCDQPTYRIQLIFAGGKRERIFCYPRRTVCRVINELIDKAANDLFGDTQLTNLLINTKMIVLFVGDEQQFSIKYEL